MGKLKYRQSFDSPLLEDIIIDLNIKQLPLSKNNLSKVLSWPKIDNDNKKKLFRRKEDVVEWLYSLFNDRFYKSLSGIHYSGWCCSTNSFTKKELKENSLKNVFYFCDYSKGLLIEVSEMEEIIELRNLPYSRDYKILKTNCSYYFY